MKSKIMRIVKRRKVKPITSVEIARRIGANPNTCRRCCGELVTEGYLWQTGHGYFATGL